MDGEMEPTIPTTAASSTSSATLESRDSRPFRILELSIISAQDLSPVSRSMRTYAIAWVQPNRKLTTHVDEEGNNNPTWNHKLSFRVNEEFLFSEDASVNVEIYTVSWFRHVLIGIVRVSLSNLIAPHQYHSSDVRYVALQVRRSSGSPQGILNMGVSLVNSTMRSMTLSTEQKHENPTDHQENEDIGDEEKKHLNAKIQQWRSLSLGTSLPGEDIGKPGSVVYDHSVINGSPYNGSMISGSELCSDIGPSASIVAAEMAYKSYHQGAPPKALRPPTPPGETESLILDDLTPEEAAEKGLTKSVTRWRKEFPLKRDEDHDYGHARRNSDIGAFSCFGSAFGIQFTIVCGSPNSNGGKGTKSVHSKNTRKKSQENLSQISV